MYISEIQRRIMNAIGVCGNHAGVFDLAVKNGANPSEMTDTYHLALWFEGAPADVKLELCRLFDEGGIYEHGLRVCSLCGKFMTEGYILDGGISYACSRECAESYYMTGQDLEEALENYPDDNFWTEWYQEL